jgi:DNA-binding transcriptional ArsR family regulator
VCVGQIQKKCGTTMSTVSAHLAMMQRAGILTSTRKGQWTYYKRNEEKIAELGNLISTQL